MKKPKKEERLDPPTPTTGDNAILLVKAVSSLFQISGAVELFERFVTPPYQRRSQKWMEEVTEALRRLEKEHGVMLETLQNDERFITVMLQASTIAVRSHQREKLTALKNVVMNSALLPNIGEDLELIFIRFVDELTPTHLYLLNFFVDNEDKLISLKSYPEIYQLFISNSKETLVQDQFKMLLVDLTARGLVWISPDIDDFEDIYQASTLLLQSTNDALPRLIVTDVAKKFLTYISYSLGA